MPRNTAFVDAFLALQLFGAVLFAFIILSACIFRGAKRHPIFFSFCVSWIVFGISYSLLLFSGQQFKSTGRVLCTIQAALIYGSPLLEMGTSLGLVIHLFLNVLSALSVSPKKHSHPTFLNVLVTLPWVIWTGIFVGVLLFGLMHREQVVMSPNFTYCVIIDNPIPKVTAVATTLGGTAIIVVEFMIGMLLYRNRAIANIFSQSMGMAIRILIFTILGFGALSCGIVFTVTKSRGVQFDLMIAILPPAAALTFGTQSDLLLGWLCWKPAVQQPPPSPDSTLLTLTTVNVASSSSHIDSDPTSRSITHSRRGSISRPPSPTPRGVIPSEATSFLHF